MGGPMGGPPMGGPMGGPPMGGPMGGPMRPQKKGLPVALMVGGGCGVLAILGVIGLIIVLVVTKGKDDDEEPVASPGDTPTEQPRPQEKTNPGQGAVYKRIPHTNVSVPIPAGWREDKVSFYTRAIAPSRDAVIAFTTVSTYGEWAGRTQHAFRVFSIRNCSFGAAVRGKLGSSKMRSRLKEGTCTWNGISANVATMLVESGRRAHPLVFYGVSKSASAKVKAQAKHVVLNIRRR